MKVHIENVRIAPFETTSHIWWTIILRTNDDKFTYGGIETHAPASTISLATFTTLTQAAITDIAAAAGPTEKLTYWLREKMAL